MKEKRLVLSTPEVGCKAVSGQGVRVSYRRVLHAARTDVHRVQKVLQLGAQRLRHLHTNTRTHARGHHDRPRHEALGLGYVTVTCRLFLVTPGALAKTMQC